MTESRIYRAWARRIESGTFTKAQCQQWAAHVWPKANGLPYHGKASNLTPQEARRLCDLLDAARGVGLTDKHTEQGITWLRRYGARALLGLPAAAVDGFRRFSFNGEAHYERNTWGGGFTAPIWHIHAEDSEGRAVRFAYYVTAWQTGNAGAWVALDNVC